MDPFRETGHMEFVSNDGYGFYSILDFLSKKGADDRMVCLHSLYVWNHIHFMLEIGIS